MHIYNPFYPPGNEYFDSDELFCTEDETLCEPDQMCLCCLTNSSEDAEFARPIVDT